MISFSFSFKIFISSFCFNIFSIFSFLISHISYFIIWHFQFMFIDNQKCWRWRRRKWNWSLRSTNTKFVYARKWPCTFHISLYIWPYFTVLHGPILGSYISATVCRAIRSYMEKNEAKRRPYTTYVYEGST